MPLEHGTFLRKSQAPESNRNSVRMKDSREPAPGLKSPEGESNSHASKARPSRSRASTSSAIRRECVGTESNRHSRRHLFYRQGGSPMPSRRIKQASCPLQELNLIFDLRKVACESGTLRGRHLLHKSLARESNPVRRLRRPSCSHHTREESLHCLCPRQESNLVRDLRRVECHPSHSKGDVLRHERPRRDLNPRLHRDRVANIPGCSTETKPTGPGGIRTLSISRSKRERSAGCLPGRQSSSGGWNRTSGLTFRAWRHDQPQLPRIREGGFEPPPPDSKSGRLPLADSRVRHARIELA